jgi:glycerol kinase
MSSQPYLLGIDQGSSGSRALILNRDGQVCGYGYRPLPCLYPRPGWVEQDPDVLAQGVTEAMAEAMAQAHCKPGQIAACGIACQRNTDFVWDARTRRPLTPAITWQDLRTESLVKQLTAWPLADQRRYRLGYFPGPYSSAIHLAWRFRHQPEVIAAAQTGSLRIGFSANWLLTTLGQPAGHYLDYSLVQQMGLYDFRARCYWNDWLATLGIPREPLPEAVPTVYPFGSLRITAGDGSSADVPVLAVTGNEQAGLLGHGCYLPGQAECSHGTASFVDVVVGPTPPAPQKLNVYFAWSLAEHPPAAGLQPSAVRHTYCLEADTTVSGAAIRWMREQARLFDRDDEVGPLAASVPDSAGVIFVPAFTGLNVPYDDRTARGTILGLTLGSSRAHIVRAFLESLGYQVRAILETIEAETGLQVEQLSMGGGIAKSDEACQIQADLVGIPIVRPAFTETAARAAALLAGIGAQWWPTLADLPPLPGSYSRFEPRLTIEQRDAGYAQWQQAITRISGWRDDKG